MINFTHTNWLLRVSTIAATVALASCGGGGGSGGDAASIASTAPSGPTAVESTATAEALPACEALPPMPQLSSNSRSVLDFGAVPDSDVDSAPAIQRAVDSLEPGQTLVFPKGRYIQGSAIWVRKNVILWSEGATLHATNPSSQAILLGADGASIYNFTLTAVTQDRRTTPWESRIAIFDRVTNLSTIKNNVIRRNRIISGDPGTPTQNGASAAGMYIYRAENFLIAENEVYRTLSDGIHMTAGSRNGKVMYNTVRETGDDMISVVSQLGSDWQSSPADKLAANYAIRADTDLAHDILVAYNNVAGQYWGRGLSVVGGRNVTLRNNTVSDTTHGAAVYIAREPSYTTFGVDNVLVRDNVFQRIQTANPVYDPVNKHIFTNQAAVEIYSQAFDDEMTYPILNANLRVSNVRVEHNTIDSTRANGIRTSTGAGSTMSFSGTDPSGAPLTRTYQSVQVGPIDLRNNTLRNIAYGPIETRGGQPNNPGIHCEGNTADSAAVTGTLCGAPAPAVRGAKIACF